MNTFSQEQNQPVREKRKQDALDADVSCAVALSIGAQPNTCFANVLDMFLLYYPAFFSAHGKLIEGWYVVDLDDEVVINEHCWCELPDGKILDPTVTLLVPPEQPVYYFAGVSRSWREVHEIVQKKDTWFPYVRAVGTYGEDGFGHPVYKAAYEMAARKVFDLASATQPPKKMTFLTAQDLQGSLGGVEIRVQLLSVSPDQHKEERPSDEKSSH